MCALITYRTDMSSLVIIPPKNTHELSTEVFISNFYSLAAVFHLCK